MEGWRREHVLGRDRAAVGDAVAEHADARHGNRLPGDGAVRRHDALRGTRHDEALRAGGRAVDRRGRVRGADESRWDCQGCTSGRRRSSRRSRSTRSTPCGGCQIHVTDRQAFRRCAVGAALLREFHRQRAAAVRVAAAAVPVRARQAADRHPRRLVGAARASRIAGAAQRNRRELEGRRRRVPRRCDRGSCCIEPIRSSGATSDRATWPNSKFGPTTDRDGLRPRAGRLTRAANLIRVPVRVLRVDLEPHRDAVVARLRVRAFAGPLGLAQTIEQLPCRLARGGKARSDASIGRS